MCFLFYFAFSGYRSNAKNDKHIPKKGNFDEQTCVLRRPACCFFHPHFFFFVMFETAIQIACVDENSYCNATILFPFDPFFPGMIMNSWNLNNRNLTK